jgi:23S rRNA pseudouridine2457 synthase
MLFIGYLKFPVHRFKADPFRRYYAFNKPYAVLCQFTVPEGSDKRTLADFDFPKDIYTVGRLDYDSEGLIILSDDGRLNTQLLTPESRHPRTYIAQVENIPTDKQLRDLADGVVIEGQITMPAKASLLTYEPKLPPRPVPIRERKNIPTAWIELTLTEGRNRQVKKMTAAVGCPTLRLIRVAIGALNLFHLHLKPGQFVMLEQKRLDSLFALGPENLSV